MPVSSKCRLCQGTSAAGIDLFRDCNGSLYSAQIKEALGIELQEIPECPRKACLTCIVVLQKIFIFRNFVADNEEELRRQYSQRDSESPEQAPHSTDDQGDANSGLAVEEQVEEEVLEEMDMMDIIEMDAEWRSPLSDSSPADTLESPTPEELDLPVITAQQEEDFFSEIIAYSDSDVIEISDGETPPATPDQPVKTPRATPKSRARVTKPKRVSLVRMRVLVTDEEEQLEAQMVQMGLFVCNVCQVDCHSLPELRQHVHRLHDSKAYELCCNRRLRYFQAGYIYDHIRWHMGSDMFKCQICHTDCLDSQCLSHHMIRMHSEGSPTFVCDVCGRGFFSKKKLKSHALIHERVDCKYCGKEFSVSFINIHIKAAHEIEVNCLCDICGKGFPNRSMLSSHISDHGGPHGGRRKKKARVKIPNSNADVFGGDYFK